jgi:predicted DNA-binding WGR domain protein
MLNALGPATIHLRAVCAARNIRRAYRIDVQPDLFGHVIVTLAWGRIGTRGQSRVCSFPSPALAQRFVMGVLRRRASAKQRIGVAYRIAP